MASVGYLTRMRVSDDGVSAGAVLIGGLTSAPFPQDREEIDSTALGDASKQALAGQWDNEITLSCHYIAADAGQVDLLAAAYADNASDANVLWLHYCPDGSTTLRKVKVRVMSANFNSEPSGTQTVEFRCRCISAPANA